MNKFIEWCIEKYNGNEDAVDLTDIQSRYDLYNEFFYSEVYKK